MDPSPHDIDPRYARFLELFNQGRYWDSHEALEEPWRQHRSDFFHSLILLASAFVHVSRGNRHGIAAQLAKAEPGLLAHAPAYLGLDVDAIIRLVREARHIVVENRDAPPDAWTVLIPTPVLRFDASLVQGDEPELTLDS